jgi:hypothetical protein
MVALHEMSAARFQLSYDGPALRSGAMDVNELAPALLATADLFREANKQLNGDRAEVSIKVRSDFKKGSFEVALIFDQTILEQAKQILLPPGGGLVGAGALVSFLFGTEMGKQGMAGVIGNVLDLWKKIRGEKPKAVVEDASKGITLVVTGDGNQINVNSRVARLYSDDIIRSSIRSTLRPVGRRGINSLTIKKGDKAINEVHKTQLPAMENTTSSHSELHGASVLEDTKEAVLRVVRANFEKGKWGFSDGSASFSADIEDDNFKKQLDAREIGFYKGDILRVILKTTQIVTPDHQQFQTNRVIETVIEHIHALRQQELPGAIPPKLLEPGD